MNWTRVIFVLLAGMFICIRLILAAEFYEIACAKGHKKIKYFIYPFLLGKTGYMMIIALPDYREKHR